jgi:DNA-binding NtrC family response regulator
LLIEDDESLWPLYSKSLKNLNADLTKVATASEASKILQSQKFDLALVDYHLPDATGISIVERYGQGLACVLVTAMGDESLVLEAMRQGAKDYVVKDASCHFLKLLPGVVSKAIEQTKLQLELDATRKRMRIVFDQASDLMIVTAFDFSILDVSKIAAKRYGAFFLELGYRLDNWIKQEILTNLVKQQVEKDLDVTVGDRIVSFKLFCRSLLDGEILFIFQDMTDAIGAKKAERVIATISQEKADLMVQNRLLANRNNIETSSILGFTKNVLALRKTITNVADTNASILILGETGTGKELVANEIHFQSQRRQSELIKLNCASIPENLVESELFGHIRGAFTGAIKDRKGKFEQANGGTLFLDEIGEISLAVQAKLLRVLQEGSFEAVGGSSVIEVDVRIIAATNRNLAGMVKQGKFRADLFYRLNVIPINVPPLRKRGNDIILLANHFIDRYCSLYGREKPILQDEYLDYLLQHSWPGNIRELQNSMERLVVLGQFQGANFTELEKPTSEVDSNSGRGSLLSMKDIEIKHLTEVLTHCRWQVSGENGAAKILELNPNTLRFRMQKLGISKARKNNNE